MFKRFLLFVAIVSLFTGCAAQSSPNTYRGSDAMRTGSVEQVTVLRVRNVVIAGDSMLSASSAVPAILSTLVGAVLGARVIGNGDGRYIAGALSGTAAGVVGQLTATHLSQRDGVEVIVRTDNGRQLVVTQGS
jgi:outer membrane lipoprotein SlyB